MKPTSFTLATRSMKRFNKKTRKAYCIIFSTHDHDFHLIDFNNIQKITNSHQYDLLCIDVVRGAHLLKNDNVRNHFFKYIDMYLLNTLSLKNQNLYIENKNNLIYSN